MLKSSPEQRVVLWRDVVTSGPDERAARVRFLAKEVQMLVASPLALYSGYDDDFEASIDLLSRSGLLGRDEFRLVFENAEEDRQSATGLILAIASLLADSGAAAHLSGDQRAQCVSLRERWLAAIDLQDGDSVDAVTQTAHQTSHDRSSARQFCTVAEVARHFDVTPQAVYRWIDKDLIEWERRPGGSYRVPADQFEDLDLALLRQTSRRRPRADAAQLKRAVGASRPEADAPDAVRSDRDDPSSTFRKADAPRSTRRLGDRRRG
jgi:transposase-like protein